MNLEDIKTVGVVGAGTMGHGIALSFVLWGYPTLLMDVKREILERARARIGEVLCSFVEGQLITRKQADDALGRLTTTLDLAAMARGADYICEAIIERSEEKKQLFNKLDAMCPPHTILTSNTSALLLSDFASEVKRQNKILVTHYFNPPHIVPCVEVVKGPGTSDETFNLVYDLLGKVRKLPVRVLRELPGYLVNRIQFAMYREACDLWAQGVASAEDIDRAVKGSFGFRLASIGPLLNMDLCGDPQMGVVAIDMFNGVFSQISNAKKIPRKLSDLWQANKGFYDYPPEKWAKITKQRDKEFLSRLRELYWS